MKISKCYSNKQAVHIPVVTTIRPNQIKTSKSSQVLACEQALIAGLMSEAIGERIKLKPGSKESQCDEPGLTPACFARLLISLYKLNYYTLNS